MFRQLKEKNKNLLRLKLKSALKIMNKYNIDFFYYAESLCFKSVIILVKDKNTSLKLPVGVSPLQLVKDWEYVLYSEKVTFSAFHYQTLSIRCEELDTHIN
jgi:hypothetical protein